LFSKPLSEVLGNFQTAFFTTRPDANAL
jgi:hypothetical protein